MKIIKNNIFQIKCYSCDKIKKTEEYYPIHIKLSKHQCKKCISIYAKESYLKNKNKLKKKYELNKESLSTHYLKNKNKILLRVKKWKLNNPDKVRAYKRKEDLRGDRDLNKKKSLW